MKTAIAYTRFSSDLQREESIEAQTRAIKKYCEDNGFVLLATYADATVIIGLKQNPTIGRRFSPIFSFIEHLSGKYGRCYT